MKKAVTIILIFTMLIVFAGCSNTNEQDDRIEILESQVASLSNDLSYVVNYLKQQQDASEQLETKETKKNYYTKEVVFTTNVSANIYDSLSLGSSYETVVSIIGDYGILDADVSANGTEIKTFMWSADSESFNTSFGYVYCKFEDDKLVKKWVEDIFA